jgi:hypothetical protein
MAEYIGLDIAGEIEGDDDEAGYDIGAAARRRPMGKAVARVVPRTPYGNPVAAGSRGPREVLYQVFGMGAATLGAAGSTLLSQVAQETFRPERLILSDSVAGNSTVTGIFLGVRPQFANLASMPAAAFAAGAFEVRVTFDTIQAGKTAQINITMAAAGTISGGFFGTMVR